MHNREGDSTLKPPSEGLALELKRMFFWRRTLKLVLMLLSRPQDLRRPTAVDILLRARDMGMKIWALEKLQRIMGTMFDTSTGEGVRQDGNARVGAAATPYGQPDLSTLLQQEKLHGPADRDLTVVPQEMTQFRGFYVYVHDMNEQTKPVMIRDYAKPERKEDGQWPQLRATPAGRCPFVDDQAHVRRLKLQEAKAKQKQLREQAQAALPRTRAALAQQQAERQRIPEQPTERRVLTENNNLALRNVNHAAQQPNDMLAKPLDPPKTIPVKRPMSTDGQNLPPPLFGSAQANLRQLPRFVAGEPVASGVQPSNVTSAIKSQMISSTAAAPGARAGTSREVHQLKRKVLEKNSAPSANSIPSSFMNDIRGAINNDRPAPRKRKAQELTQIDEDMEDAEEDARQQKAKVARKKKQQTEKDLKPGYCENCHDKFNDFEDVSADYR